MSLGEERHCMLRPLDTLLVMARLSRRKGGVSSSTCGCCWHLSAGWRHDPGAWGGGCPPGPHGSGARAENVAGGAARAALGHAGRDAGLAAAPASQPWQQWPTAWGPERSDPWWSALRQHVHPGTPGQGVVTGVGSADPPHLGLPPWSCFETCGKP